ncbi:MAG TPA: aminopeptidase [Ktedonobacteraceae bacterium]|nr:aminopeptidase [Ktedonobacteraceae bacterium]
MRDIRIKRWAHTLVHYSLSVKPGDLVAIHGTSLAAPLIEAVYHEILEVGAHPLPVIELESLEEILLKEGNDEQLTMPSPISEALSQRIDARLFISSRSNPKSLSSVSPSRMALRREAAREIGRTFRKREQAGAYRWCGTLYPTTGFAQDADMSLREFEEFVFDVCFLNDPNPIDRWKELAARQQKLVDWLVGHKQVHIKGEHTDLKLSVDGRIFINSDGKRNFPSGEFFTSPVENSANGVIHFDIPSSYDGRTIEGVRLVFKDGKVTEASARQGNSYLQQMLEVDEGARRLGEFAFGNNRHIQRGTKNILFDEKIGGTVHLALGACYPETGGLNQSGIHWDMVCDLRHQGEVWVDDVLFLKNGEFKV